MAGEANQTMEQLPAQIQTGRGKPEQLQEHAVYSVFTIGQKRWIIFLVAFAGWFSTLSSFIFFPAIPSMARDLRTSVEDINLTVTSYLIVSGVVPSIVGDSADMAGRRPTLITILGIYIAANVGLALQDSFVALFLLRMLQSAGISGSFAIAYGATGDVSTPAERGTFVGMVAFGTNTAPSFGPILSAAINARLGWRWIFWFLAIMSGSCLILVDPAVKIGLSKKYGYVQPANTRAWNLAYPDPLKCLSILKRNDSLIVISVISIFYATYSCVAASLSSLFVETYHLNELDAGLIYLPFGTACAITAYVTGKVLDRDYRVTAESRGLSVDKAKGDDLHGFPIEVARLRTVFWYICLAVVASIGYGWALESKTHISVPLIIQFFLGSMIQAVFTTLNTLLVDLHQDHASTAQASCNFVRCMLAAASLAVVQVVIDGVGVGWCFTIFGGFCCLSVPLLMVERSRGMSWRQARR